jgi:hypothetical protein
MRLPELPQCIIGLQFLVFPGGDSDACRQFMGLFIRNDVLWGIKLDRNVELLTNGDRPVSRFSQVCRQVPRLDPEFAAWYCCRYQARDKAHQQAR